jgi:hypothetical protein
LFVLFGAPVPVLHNTLIAGNFRGATGTARDDVYGPLNPAGDYNLIGDGSGMTGLSNGVNGNLVGNYAAPLDPLLGPLQDNGGPTQTMALLPGSPAIDAGNNAYATEWDQRGEGFPRVVGILDPDNPVIDIGAFEVQADGPSPSAPRHRGGHTPPEAALRAGALPLVGGPLGLFSEWRFGQPATPRATPAVPTFEANSDPKVGATDRVFAAVGEEKPGRITSGSVHGHSAELAGRIGGRRFDEIGLLIEVGAATAE